MDIPAKQRTIVVAKRPTGQPQASDFALREVAVPEPHEGQVLVRIIYLSLDPYLRGVMSEGGALGVSMALGQPMRGGAVGEVVASRHPDYRVGDIIEDTLEWANYSLGPLLQMRKIDPAVAPLSTANSILGMTGMTAYFGLLEIGQARPGETVVVSAASGGVGQVVGQLAKIIGCRAVGIAGGPAKCRYVVNELGFDACLDYKAEADLQGAIKAACPAGVDVYFDLVGGPVSDAAIANVNLYGRIALCGSISQHAGAATGPRQLGTFVGRRIKAQGFIVWDHRLHWPHALRAMGELVRSGRLKYRDDITDGLENAPAAFAGMLTGTNFGKAQVRVGPEPLRR